MQAQITKTVTNWNVSPSRETVTDEKIEAATKDEMFALFFKDYDNRFKYCNDINYRFQDGGLSDEYNVWRSDVSNYAKAGGDMW